MKLVWVRRSIVIPAVIIMFVSVQCSLFLNLIANDFQDPEFYMEILSEDSVYSFISVELPSSVYQEFEELQLKENFPDLVNELGLSEEEIIESMSGVIDQAWVQAIVEQNGVLVLQYLNGTSDEFVVQIDFGPVVLNASREMTELVEASDIYQFTIDKVVNETFEDGLILPLGIYFSESEIAEVIVETIPRGWVVKQINDSSDLLLRFLIGTDNELEIIVPIYELEMPIKNNLKIIIKNENIEEYIREEILFYLTESSVTGITDLNREVYLSNEEIEKIVEDVLSEEWLQNTLDSLVDMSVDYLLGDIELKAIEFNVSEIKELAGAELERIVGLKLDANLGSLRQCTKKEMERYTFLSSQGLPICFPGDYYNQHSSNTRETYRLDLVYSLHDEILDNLPNVVRIRDTDIDKFIERTFSGDVGGIEGVRDKLRHGWKIDSKYLNEISGENDRFNDLWTNIQSVSPYLKDGFRYDNHDLKNDMAGFYDVERIRKVLFIARVFEYISLIVVIVLALLVGFLTHNDWSKRAVVASISVTLCYLVVFLIWTGVGGLSLASYVVNSIGAVKETVLSETDSVTMALIVDKIFSMFRLATQDLIKSMIGMALNCLYIGILISLVAVGLSHYSKVTKFFSKILLDR